MRGVALLVILVMLAGCAAGKAYHDGQRFMKREDYDRAVLRYSKAVALRPGNARYEVALQRAKLRASSEHFNKGKLYQASGQLELAIAEYQQTLALNPSNTHAENELQKAALELRRKQGTLEGWLIWAIFG